MTTDRATPRPTVAALLGGPIALVRPTATLRGAAETLAADEIGLLVVGDAGGMRGVLSERDLVRAVAAGADLDTERVRDHASTEVVTAPDDTSVEDAGRMMREADIRHLVITRGRHPVGVVSVRDLLPVLLDPAPATA
jgi:CBS domain-containing protein